MAQEHLQCATAATTSGRFPSRKAYWQPRMPYFPAQRPVTQPKIAFEFRLNDLRDGAVRTDLSDQTICGIDE
jgi:hypothetical protein